MKIDGPNGLVKNLAIFAHLHLSGKFALSKDKSAKITTKKLMLFVVLKNKKDMEKNDSEMRI